MGYIKTPELREYDKLEFELMDPRKSKELWAKENKTRQQLVGVRIKVNGEEITKKQVGHLNPSELFDGLCEALKPGTFENIDGAYLYKCIACGLTDCERYWCIVRDEDDCITWRTPENKYTFDKNEYRSAMTELCDFSRSLENNHFEKGLKVNSVFDNNDYSVITFIDMQFSVPFLEEEIDEDAFYAIKYLAKVYLSKTKYWDDVIHYAPQYGFSRTGISLHLMNYIKEEEGLNLVKNICEYIMNIEKGKSRSKNEEDVISRLQRGLDSAKLYVGKYLEEITNNGRYFYKCVDVQSF